jgi:hypothetical protein
MVNVVGTKEYLEQGDWIHALQEEAIKTTADTKKIVEDFNKTAEKIQELQKTTLRRRMPIVWEIPNTKYSRGIEISDETRNQAKNIPNKSIDELSTEIKKVETRMDEINKNWIFRSANPSPERAKLFQEYNDLWNQRWLLKEQISMIKKSETNWWDVGKEREEPRIEDKKNTESNEKKEVSNQKFLNNFALKEWWKLHLIKKLSEIEDFYWNGVKAIELTKWDNDSTKEKLLKSLWEEKKINNDKVKQNIATLLKFCKTLWERNWEHIFAFIGNDWAIHLINDIDTWHYIIPKWLMETWDVWSLAKPSKIDPSKMERWGKQIDDFKNIGEENELLEFWTNQPLVSNNSISRKPTSSLNKTKLSEKHILEIDKFKKEAMDDWNTPHPLMLENAYSFIDENWKEVKLDILIISLGWSSINLLIDKNYNWKTSPIRMPIDGDIKSRIDGAYGFGDKISEKIVGYCGWLGQWSFSSWWFSAISHYWQAIVHDDKYKGKWLWHALRDIKEYCDGRLKNEYSWQKDNTKFLLKRWYKITWYIDKNSNIVPMDQGKLQEIQKILDDKNTPNKLPYSIQLKYNWNDSVPFKGKEWVKRIKPLDQIEEWVKSTRTPPPVKEGVYQKWQEQFNNIKEPTWNQENSIEKEPLNWWWTLNLKDWTKSEGIFKNWILIQWKRTNPDWITFEWDFKLGDLRNGKIIDKDWHIVKEYSQGKEVATKQPDATKPNESVWNKPETKNQIAQRLFMERQANKRKEEPLNWQWVRVLDDWTRSEGIFKNWILIQWSRTNSDWTVFKWDFKLGDLRNGKIIDKDWHIVKEYSQGKEVSEKQPDVIKPVENDWNATETNIQRNKRLFEERIAAEKAAKNNQPLNWQWINVPDDWTVLNDEQIRKREDENGQWTQKKTENISAFLSTTLPRNITNKEWNEVPRDTETIVIGDLDGNYDVFKKKLKKTWLVDDSWHWIWWKERVVFQWDILADRNQDWLKILKEIHNLRKQANEKWWNMLIIVGNHDFIMKGYLISSSSEKIVNWVEDAEHQNQWPWLLELMKFKKWTPNYTEKEMFDYMKNPNVRNEILSNMRNDTEWKIILEELCSMKVIEQIDDCLYLHTNPTDNILNNLTNGNLQQNIDNINTVYQNYLRKSLLWEMNASNADDFSSIITLFLATSNRKTSNTEEYYNTLHKQWINYIAHGHSRWGWKTIQVGAVKIVDNNYEDNDKISKIWLDGDLYVWDINKGLHKLEENFANFDKKLNELNKMTESTSLPDEKLWNDVVSEYNSNIDFYKKITASVFDEGKIVYSRFHPWFMIGYYDKELKNNPKYIAPLK